MLSFPDFRYKQVIVHIAQLRGEKLKFRADNILIESADGDVVLQHSCHRVFALFIVGEITLTSVIIKQAVRFAFPIILMGSNLKVLARFNSAAEGNTALRYRQYHSTRNFDIAKNLIAQKIVNQASLLNMLRYRSKSDRAVVKQLQSCDVTLAADGAALMGMEGNCSRLFFQEYFRSLNWVRREPRCKRDITNLLLDIGYTYLFNFMEAHLCLYGFDLYCGVHHRYFYQRKSLVCDLVEPFRCIIDKRIRKAYNLRQINQDDFFVKQNAYQLAWKQQKKYTRLFLKDILEHKEEIFRYCQAYYRWVMKDSDLSLFPQFCIIPES